MRCFSRIYHSFIYLGYAADCIEQPRILEIKFVDESFHVLITSTAPSYTVFYKNKQYNNVRLPKKSPKS